MFETKLCRRCDIPRIVCMCKPELLSPDELSAQIAELEIHNPSTTQRDIRLHSLKCQQTLNSADSALTSYFAQAVKI